MTEKQAPDAQLLLATGCAHCPVVLEGLTQLLKQGKIGRLEAINIVEHPEAAQEAGTRSVPWTRIGEFELEGALSPKELARWVELAGDEAGFSEYYSHLLESQRAHQVIALIKKRPKTLSKLIDLLKSDATPMAARIGVGVVIEALEGNDILHQILPDLTALTRSEEPNVRADAAHFLGVTRHPAAAEPLKPLLSDSHPDVREIAADSLEMLQSEEN
ncbi:MAG: HEAT repeat domain-containing protein [Candidatus Thiodiazotropha sp. (ex Monitilora ramsayi)]|nr:HEAT repeat domain-containing protein [Candidatus Thiodiazotropha sp. (ex Monitilora ramsayi)]